MMSFEEDDEFTLPSRTRKANQHAEDAPARPIARVFKSVGVAPKTGPQPTPTTPCGTCGLVSENLKCPQCAGRRNRDHVERTRTAVRAFKAALETMAPDSEYRELRKDLVALTWPGYVQDLEAAVAARLESKGKGR